jgi:mRNA interferase RelE/StbE
MTYELAFHPDAMKEWEKLDGNIKNQFKKKLAERLTQPHVPGALLRGRANIYKIKLRAVGYRLIYQVDDDKVLVLVVSIGRRDRSDTYKRALTRK